MRRHLGGATLLVALVVLVCIASSEALGTCSSAHPRAPKSSLQTKSTASSLVGTRLRVFPRIPQTKEVVTKYYVDAEVFMLREMEPASQCIKSNDPNTLGYPYIQQVDTSECNCTHTPGFDFFPGTSVRRDYVKVTFDCANFASLALTLDVNIVNASHAVEHIAAMGPNATTYDYYTPDSVKFNVSANNWPWSAEPESYLAFWIRTTVNAVGFNLTTSSTTDSLRIELRNKDFLMIEEVQRSFVMDGFSYLTSLPSTFTEGFELPSAFTIENGISMCFNNTFIPLRATNFSYDPTLSALFLGTIEPKRSNVAKIVAPVVVVSVLLIIVIFVIIARRTPAIKNFFRPYRNPAKDGAKYSKKHVSPR